jgi:hypothetical protein
MVKSALANFRNTCSSNRGSSAPMRQAGDVFGETAGRCRSEGQGYFRKNHRGHRDRYIRGAVFDVERRRRARRAANLVRVGGDPDATKR